MLFQKDAYIKVFLILVLLNLPSFAGAMNLNEIMTLKRDGSGSITFVYWEKESIVKQKNDIIGNFPFNKDSSEHYFNSPTTYIQLFKAGQYDKDNSFTEVSVTVAFTDINKLNGILALKDSQDTLYQTDSGSVFRYIITPAFTRNNSLENVYIILNYEGKVISTDGVITDKNIGWYRAKEYLHSSINLYFFATLEPLTNNKVDVNKNSNTSTGTKEKSCGLFGFELPFILLFGLMIRKISRKRKK